MPEPSSKTEKALFIIACVACTLITSLVCANGLDISPFEVDDAVFLFQAKLFAAGKVFADTPEHVGLIPVPYMFEYFHGRWFAAGFVGNLLFLGLAQAVGSAFYAPIIFTTYSVALVYGFTRKAYGKALAWLTLVLAVLSPMTSGMGATLYSENTSRFALALFLFGYFSLLSSFKEENKKKLILLFGVICGVGMGLALITRPLTGVCFAAPIALHALVVLVRGPKRLTTLTSFATALVAACIVTSINLLWSGYVFDDPLRVAHKDKLGFDEASPAEERFERIWKTLLPNISYNALGWGRIFQDEPLNHYLPFAVHAEAGLRLGPKDDFNAPKFRLIGIRDGKARIDFTYVAGAKAQKTEKTKSDVDGVEGVIGAKPFFCAYGDCSIEFRISIEDGMANAQFKGRNNSGFNNIKPIPLSRSSLQALTFETGARGFPGIFKSKFKDIVITYKGSSEPQKLLDSARRTIDINTPRDLETNRQFTETEVNSEFNYITINSGSNYSDRAQENTTISLDLDDVIKTISGTIELNWRDLEITNDYLSFSRTPTVSELFSAVLELSRKAPDYAAVLVLLLVSLLPLVLIFVPLLHRSRTQVDAILFSILVTVIVAHAFHRWGTFLNVLLPHRVRFYTEIITLCFLPLTARAISIIWNATNFQRIVLNYCSKAFLLFFGILLMTNSVFTILRTTEEFARIRRESEQPQGLRTILPKLLDYLEIEKSVIFVYKSDSVHLLPIGEYPSRSLEESKYLYFMTDNPTTWEDDYKKLFTNRTPYSFSTDGLKKLAFSKRD